VRKKERGRERGDDELVEERRTRNSLGGLTLFYRILLGLGRLCRLGIWSLTRSY
jgi:hypothetical protein